MRFMMTPLAMLCAGSMLFACADLARHTEPAGLHAAADADQSYVRGRAEQRAGRHEAALDAYRQAVAAAPQHINARNGMATVYAEQGDLARAITLWQGMTESADAADHAFLFTNLGYAYFLDGQYEQAIAALQKACALDPLGARSWQYLGDALDKHGDPRRAKTMWRQARQLQGHDFKADYAVAARVGVNAIDNAVQAMQAWDDTTIEEDSSGVFVLRRVRVAGARAALGADSATLLEISNGNGIAGMARSMGTRVRSEDLRVVRLSNQKGFSVQQTRIEYQLSHRGAAEALGQRIGVERLTEVPAMQGAHVRLVIGRDLAGQRSPARSPG